MQLDQLRRREFITLLGGAAATWPLVARAQQRTMSVVGFLHAGSFSTTVEQMTGLRKGLAETGYLVGQNLAIEYRAAEGRYDRLQALVTDLLQQQVAVLVAGGGNAPAQAAKAATANIPIVFVTGSDPIRAGLVASLNRPGGNVTGVSFLANTLIAKQLQLLQGLAPASRVIGALINPGNPNAASDSLQAQAAAASLRLEVHIVHTATQRDFDAAFDDLVRAQAGAVLIFPDVLFTDVRARLVELAIRNRLPVLYPERSFIEAGGLLSYGSNRTDAYREAGIYAGRILRGERPGDLPVIQASKFELVINLKTAKAAGLELPPTLLALADEVIE
jgi:putative ABC transport system substrate-binding protein